MPRGIVIAACVLAIAGTSNTNSFGLVFARAAEGLGLTVAALGGLRTLENAAAIIVAIIVAPLVDRFARKRVLMVGFLAASMAPIILVTLNSAPGAILFFLLNGASIVLILATLTAIPGDFVSGRVLNRVMGLIIGCVAFTSILVAPVVGQVAENVGWQAGMLVSATVAGIALLITALIVPDYRVESSGSSPGGVLQRYGALLSQRRLILMLSSNLLRFAQLGSMMTFASTVLIQRYDLSLGAIGLVFPAIGIMFFLSSVGCGLVLHRVKTRRVLIMGGTLATCLILVVLVLEPPLRLMLPCLVLLIGTIVAQIQAGTIAVLRLSPWARGSAMSWNELAAGAGSLLGIGFGSLGLAIGGVTGLGVALLLVAASGTLVSHAAMRYAGYTDEDDVTEPVRTSLA